jgi:uncharacterized metal-binding protein
MYTCAYCTKKACMTAETDAMPRNCPCRDPELTECSKALYQEEDLKIAMQACRTEYEGYCIRTRVEEVMEFASNMGYKKLGIAHCVGLTREAGLAARIYSANGFNVESICCKCGTIPKSGMGMGQWQIDKSYEPMCNPIGQAMALEKAGCELAVIVGLCVGHDTLFIRHCKLPVTCLVVKDRVTGHNPAAALYLSEGYYKDRLFPPKRVKGDLFGNRAYDEKPR